jgi:predicted TPR repeat methyltransferase
MGAAESSLQDAIALHKAGDYAAAELGYCEYLQRAPMDPSALHFLGLLRSQQGKNREAILLMLQSLEADPQYIDAWSNLGLAFYAERDLERAEKCCRRALELSPDFVNAWANLGMTLRACERFDEALRAWERALELRPMMRTVAVPYGQLLYLLNRLDEAREFYQRWCTACPGDPIARHMLAAAGGAAAPARASDDYVRTTFDGNAYSFDRNLERLRYQAPKLLSEAVKASYPASRMGSLEVLDLGCGTGLCGPLLRPIARRLVGVDLSAKMLSQAAARAVYDQLNLGELTEWLAGCRERYDVAVAADVLCYFGELATVLPRVRQVLKSQGRFGFSLEALTGDAAPYTLQVHGRYQHTAGYVDAMLQQAGFTETQRSEAVLRYERKAPVPGHVVLASAGKSEGPVLAAKQTTSEERQRSSS